MPNGRMDTVFVCLLGFWPGLSSIRQLRIFSSGIRALHTDQGFLDPLVDCLWLQRVVHGIKCCQDPLPSTRLLIMDELMLVFWQCLDLSLPDHQLLWAACSLGYFGFLSALEFTVPNLSSYSSSLHFSVQDITVDSSSAPSSMCIQIKGSKSEPSQKVCFINIGLGRHPLCAVHTMKTCLA